MIVAQAYAKALYEAAHEAKMDASALDQIELQLKQALDAVSANGDLRTALVGPVTTSKEKVALAEALAKLMKASPLLQNFLALLARKERFALLERVHAFFISVRLEREGGMAGELEVAAPMNESDVDGLAQAFSKKLGKKIAFQVSTNPELLAGMRVTVNGVTYDGSLRSQLQRLRERLVFGEAQAEKM